MTPDDPTDPHYLCVGVYAYEDALELLDEALPYVPEYFREKWDMDARRAVIGGVMAPGMHTYGPGGTPCEKPPAPPVVAEQTVTWVVEDGFTAPPYATSWAEVSGHFRDRASARGRLASLKAIQPDRTYRLVEVTTSRRVVEGQQP